MKKRILVIDTYELVSVALGGLMSDRSDYVFLPQASSLKSAVRQIGAQVDLVIVDPQQLDNAALLPEVRENHPDVRILVFTNNDDPDDVRLALQQGVDGYILKQAAKKDMIDAIDSVIEGRMYVHPGVSRALVENRREEQAAEQLLTRRQEQILTMIAEGMTVKQIATALDLSAKTIESHRVTLMNRLGIHHVPGLVHFAIRHGYVKLGTIGPGKATRCA